MSKVTKQVSQRARKPKATKPELSSDDKVRKLYRSLHDQLESGYNANALKTCDRILRLDSEDALASHTKIQLLLALDRYLPALDLLAKSDAPGTKYAQEKAYCLYKTGRIQEASKAVEELREQAEEERAVQLLDAQIKYRLEDYKASAEVYEDLLATADHDSPEVQDLQTNLNAAQSHIDFTAQVPAAVSSSTVPPLERLETNPVAHIIHSHPAYKHASTSKSTFVTQQSSNTKGKPKKGGDASKLDPDRWLPKRERPDFAEEIVRKREQDRGRKKQRIQQQAMLTQGSAEPVSSSGAGSGKNASTGGGAGGGGAGKKKKGKR